MVMPTSLPLDSWTTLLSAHPLPLRPNSPSVT